MSKIGLIEDCVNKLKFGKEIYMDIKEVLSRPEYSFIQANPHLGGSMLFVTFGGSHAYGTNKPTSDIDIRGCALNSRKDLVGRSNFEQFLINRQILPSILLIS